MTPILTAPIFMLFAIAMGYNPSEIKIDIEIYEIYKKAL
jgi:hypothetical protein